MPLTCECDGDYDDAQWYWWAPDDYSTMPEQRRRRRCQSCQTLIANGAVVARFERSRYAISYIEECIYGEGCDVPLAAHYLCETCADLYFSLIELGFCGVGPGENMRELVREYASLRDRLPDQEVS